MVLPMGRVVAAEELVTTHSELRVKLTSTVTGVVWWTLYCTSVGTGPCAETVEIPRTDQRATPRRERRLFITLTNLRGLYEVQLRGLAVPWRHGTVTAHMEFDRILGLRRCQGKIFLHIDFVASARGITGWRFGGITAAS